MRTVCSWTTMVAVIWLSLGEISSGQELRVYTQVYNEGAAVSQPDHKAPIVARSLSLFHAGKVYDYIASIGELTVFEPNQNRFIILNGSHSPMMATVVTFDEIKQLLKIGRQETDNYVEQLKSHGDTESQRAIAPLRFQLNPSFQYQYNEKVHTLRLTGDYIRYDVQCAEVTSAETVEMYLAYADWAARLNYVLHPQVPYPAPRLLLNDRLREHQVLPVVVELRANFENQLHLRAEHKIHWDFNAKDRSDIHHWETLLKNKSMKFVPLREYQQALLLPNAIQRR